jgi:hypothetical protein
LPGLLPAALTEATNPRRPDRHAGETFFDGPGVRRLPERGRRGLVLSLLAHRPTIANPPPKTCWRVFARYEGHDRAGGRGAFVDPKAVVAEHENPCEQRLA